MVFVTLATHNGATYLPQLIQSIREQTYGKWRMFVRDDASSDKTMSLIREAAIADSRINVLYDDSGRCGPAENFGRLLQAACDSQAKYVFLADQDDLWSPEKISKQLGLMRTTEALVGREVPVLICSDLEVVDSALRTIYRSFFRHMRLRHADRSVLKSLLVRNYLPGCAMLINRPLLEFALPLPAEAPMHDWWLGLCAAAAGQTGFLAEPLVLYRQHGGNAIGAGKWWKDTDPLAKNWKKRWQTGMANFIGNVQQIRQLRDRLQERAAHAGREKLALLNRYCRLFEGSAGAFRRICEIRRLGLFGTGFFRSLAFHGQLLMFDRYRCSPK